MKHTGTPHQSTTATHRLRLTAACATLTGLTFMLTGCGTGYVGKTGIGGSSTAAVTHVTGNVHGGQQPVAGATIQLYQVGSSGLFSASTPLIGATVTTATDGSFNITGQYTCPTSGSSNVYLAATGGNPGSGSNNTAIALVAALGNCGNLSASTFVSMNEVTTVAAAYALGPFASDLTHIGAPSNLAQGMNVAFNNASVLANTATGTSGPATAAAGVTVPTAEINELGNILAACVNTTGAASTQCTMLFAATGAADTFGANLAIQKNPGASAITALYVMSNGTAPFQPTQNTAQPKDYTLAVQSTANASLASPYGIALDANNIPYITNEAGTTLVQLGQSNPSFVQSYTSPSLYGAQGLSVDRQGNVWVANTAGNSLLRYPVSFFALGAPTAYTTGITAPSAVANDSAGNAFVANYNGNSVAGFNANGAPLSGSPFTGNGVITVPLGIAVGPAGNVYVTSGTGGAVVKLTNAGAFSASYNDGTLQGPMALAVDATGRIAVSGATTGTAVGPALGEFTNAGAYASVSPVVSGLSNPQGVATDGTSFFVANSVAAGGLAKIAYGASAPVSPAAGYGSLNMPQGVAVDQAGCVWVTNVGSNTVTKFFGLSTPVLTPIAANVGP